MEVNDEIKTVIISAVEYACKLTDNNYVKSNLKRILEILRDYGILYETILFGGKYMRADVTVYIKNVVLDIFDSSWDARNDKTISSDKNVEVFKFLTNFYNSETSNIFIREIIEGVRDFVLSETNKDYIIDYFEMENLVCMIKAIGLENVILMLADSTKLYDFFSNLRISNMSYVNTSIFEFKTVCTILNDQILHAQKKEDLDLIIEKYKFIYTFAKKDDRRENLNKDKIVLIWFFLILLVF